MARALRRIALAAVVLLLVAAAAFTLSVRPDLDDARTTAEDRWDVVRESLDARYALLADLTEAVGGAGGLTPGVVDDLDEALARWGDSDTASVSHQVEVANDLEGLARRLEAIVAASARLAADDAVRSALDAWATSTLPESARAFDTAVAEYQAEREGFLRRRAADLLGYDPIPTLDLGDTPPPSP